MISLNQQTTQTVMTGSISASGAGGFVLWVESNYSLISLGFVAFAGLVGLAASVVTWHFQKERNTREQEFHAARMDALSETE